MIQHTFNAVQVRVDQLPDGGRQLAIVHPNSGEVWLLPLDADAARSLGHALTSAIHVPTNGKAPL